MSIINNIFNNPLKRVHEGQEIQVQDKSKRLKPFFYNYEVVAKNNSLLFVKRKIEFNSNNFINPLISNLNPICQSLNYKIHQAKNSDERRNVLFEAVEKGYTGFLSIVMKSEDVQLRDKDGNSLFHHACKKRKQDVLNLLLMRSADVNDVTKMQNTGLHLASVLGFEEIAKLLLENNANVNLKNIHGFTALHAACRFGHISVVRLLLAQKEIDLNAVDSKGNNALISALSREKEDIAHLLIDAGADVSLVNSPGYNAKIFALEYGFVSVSDKIPMDRYSREFLDTKLLAHLLQLKGKTVFPNQIECQHEGLTTFFSCAAIARSLKEFLISQYNCLEDQSEGSEMDLETKTVQSKDFDFSFKEINLLIKAFMEGCEKKRDSALFASDIRQGKLVVLPVSWQKHAVYVVFYKGIMVICNRGKRRDGTSAVFPLPIDVKKVNFDNIELIRKRNDSYDDGFERVYVNFVNQVKSSLTEHHACELLKTHALPHQTVGNCSFANGEQALHSAALMLAVMEKPTLTHLELNQIIGERKKTLQLWSLQTALSYFNDYLKRLETGNSLAQNRGLLDAAWEKIEILFEEQKEIPSLRLIDQFQNLKKRSYAQQIKDLPLSTSPKGVFYRIKKHHMEYTNLNKNSFFKLLKLEMNQLVLICSEPIIMKKYFIDCGFQEESLREQSEENDPHHPFLVVTLSDFNLKKKMLKILGDHNTFPINWQIRL